MPAYPGGVPATGTLRPRGWYPEPRNRGHEGRATRAQYSASTTNRTVPLEPEYPPERVRLEEAPEFEGVYDRQDGAFNTALGPGAGLTATFSGVPDSIDIGAGAIGQVLLFDQNGIQLGPSFIVGANSVYTTNLAARSAQVFNLSAGAAAFSILGKWLRQRDVQPRAAPAGAPA